MVQKKEIIEFGNRIWIKKVNNYIFVNIHHLIYNEISKRVFTFKYKVSLKIFKISLLLLIYLFHLWYSIWSYFRHIFTHIFNKIFLWILISSVLDSYLPLIHMLQLRSMSDKIRNYVRKFNHIWLHACYNKQGHIPV